ncbi:MAG: prephenate dehydratase [Nitrososphaerota archaeon]
MNIAMKVAFQGEKGSYSEEAVIKHFGAGAEPIPKRTISAVFSAVEVGEVDAGVVPIENSIEGSVTETYDLLLTTSLKVIGEIYLKIVHCLIGLPGTDIKSIKRVYSHPQAISQCRGYIASMGFEYISIYDTAGAVKLIKETGDKTAAAIASERAAEIYGMQILARSIEDYGRNYTRFLIIGKNNPPPGERCKTTVIFTLSHIPGALYQALGAFALRGINLTKIESRPTRSRPWQYNFYIDFEGSIEEKHVKEALAELSSKTLFLKVLGSYPMAVVEYE